MFLNPKKLLALAHIQPGMLIADFETTNSYIPLEIGRLLKNEGKIYVTGSNKELLKRVGSEAKHQHITSLEILSGHIEKNEGIPLRDGTLDLIVMSNVLFSVDEKNNCLKEASRLLRKGGRVLLTDWVDSFAGIGPHKDHVIKKNDALNLFTESGFELMNEIDAGHYHYGFIFQKKSN